MAYLPYAVRHLQRTMEDHVLTYLTALGWLGPTGAVPFGASIASFQRGALPESDLVSAKGNIVTVSFGGEGDDDPQEMGGGLMLVEQPIFVDCLGEKDAVALSIASDVKDLLAGRAPGTTRYVTLVDQRTATDVLGYRIELTDVVREEGNASVRRSWQIVKATIEMTYIAEDDGS